MSTVLREILDWRTVPAGTVAQWRAEMDAEKRARVEKLRRTDDQTRSICADHLARKLLLRAGAGPEQLKFTRTSRGKPLCPASGLHFSLSHSGFYVACVVAESEVGLDIEMLRPVRQELAHRVCTEAELAWLFPAGTFDAARFLALWTAKEAYLKFTGEGIDTDLRRIAAADAGGLLPCVCGRELLHETAEEYVLSLVR